MKIAMVFDLMIWGGIERVGISYIDLLQKLGHEVDVYIVNENTESIVDELKEKCSVTVVGIKNVKCPESIWGILTEHDMHGVEAVYYTTKYLGLKLSQKFGKHKYSKKKYDVAIAFSGHIRDLTFVADDYISARKKIAWLHGVQAEYGLNSPGFFKLYSKIKNLVSLADMFDMACEKYNNRHGIQKVKMYNPCLIDTQNYSEDKVKELRHQYGDYCVMIGRLAQDKDQKTVLKAMKYLKEELGLKKKLLLVGDGDQRQELEKLAETLQIREDVEFTGNRSDVSNYYKAAEVYVHAAPLEGFPTVFMEAMSFGVPIATTDAIPGTREMLGNSEYGLICGNEDYKALAQNIYQLYTDRELRNNFINKGYQRVQDFAPDTIMKQLDELLMKITNER